MDMRAISSAFILYSGSSRLIPGETTQYEQQRTSHKRTEQHTVGLHVTSKVCGPLHGTSTCATVDPACLCTAANKACVETRCLVYLNGICRKEPILAITYDGGVCACYCVFELQIRRLKSLIGFSLDLRLV